MASDHALPADAPARERIERRLPPARVARSLAKRLFDRIGALALLIVSAPLLILVAAAIRLDSSGPILFRQRRIGLHGQSFTVFKFRSMQDGCDQEPHRQYVRGLVTGENETRNGNGAFKLTQDDRVTRLGAWLRRTSLDEVPQLWNVLRGDMSLVGPRPPLPYEVEQYDDRQWERLTCKPGLTGLWQVSGRNHLSYRNMVDLDVEYIRNWNFWLDLKILSKTLPVVLKNTGNAH